MSRPEIDQDAIRQDELRVELGAEFGPRIGHAMWQYLGGLASISERATTDQRIELMRSSEIALSEAISVARDSSSPHERFLADRAIIRLATIRSGD